MSLIIKKDRCDSSNKSCFNLVGELDLSSASSLVDELKDSYGENKTDILLDFKEIDFVDSTGLGALVTFSKSMKSEHKLSIINTKKHVRKVFSITGLDQIFFCEDY